MKKEVLEKTAKEYYQSAEDELKKNRFNSAVVLYFKSLISIIDLYILIKTGDTPSSHNDRFRIAQTFFLEIYEILDKDFPFYYDSYINIMTRELAEVIKEDVKKLAEKTKISL